MIFAKVFLSLFFLAFVCLVIGASDWFLTHWRIWQEVRAIARRDAEQAKHDAAEKKRQDDLRKWCLVAYPPKPQRIAQADIDPAYRTGQFSIPRQLLDRKGATKL